MQNPGHYTAPSLKMPISKDGHPTIGTSILKNGHFQGRHPLIKRFRPQKRAFSRTEPY